MDTNEKQASAASQRRIVSNIITDAEAGKVVWVFADGQQLSLYASDMPAAIVAECLVYGMKQKGADMYSGNEGIADAFAKLNAGITNLKAGVWSTRGSGSSDLATAIARGKGIDLDEAIAIVNGMTPDQRKALQATPKVKALIAEIKAERLAKNADAADDFNWDAIGE